MQYWPIDRINHQMVDALPDAAGSDGADPSLMALLASLAGGAVAHGQHYLPTLSASCPGPVIALPLCYPDMGSVAPKPSTGGEVVIVTLGMINANKQPDRVMHAMARSQLLRGRARYRLIGPIESAQAQRLNALALDLGLQPPEIFGWVSDKRLFELLSEADVVCCLRYPILEGGSASLISALYSARPVVVGNAGAYADVPDKLVSKVSYGLDPDDLCLALEAICADRAGADARASRAKLWAEHTYSAEAYVDGLVPHLERCLSGLPLINAGRLLGAAVGVPGAGFWEPTAQRIGGVLQELFSRELSS
jgi:glycosyltransferase involved in cell wall biosynthesis